MNIDEYEESLNDPKFFSKVKKFETCCLFYKTNKTNGKYNVLPIFNYYKKII